MKIEKGKTTRRIPNPNIDTPGPATYNYSQHSK